MTLIQKFFLRVLPRRWADDMRAESQMWRIRCSGCGASRSLWESGGIRWKGTSRTKLTLIRCSHCGGWRKAFVEKTSELA